MTLNTEADHGIYGAKVQSWRRVNPRDLLRRLLKENSNAGKLALFEMFWNEVRDDRSEEYLKSITEYWFANNYHSLTDKPKIMLASKGKGIEPIKDVIREKIIVQAKIILLDLLMPNGKSLGDCTAIECNKMGGWLKEIAKKLKPHQQVRSVLSENDLRKLYRKG